MPKNLHHENFNIWRIFLPVRGSIHIHHQSIFISSHINVMCTPEPDVKSTPDEKLWTQPSLTCIVRPNPNFSLQNCYEDNRKETKVSNADALSHTRLWGTSQYKSLENYDLLFQCKLSEQKFYLTKSTNPLFFLLQILHKFCSFFLCSHNPSQSSQQCLVQCWVDIRFFPYSSTSVICLFVIHWFWLWLFFWRNPLVISCKDIKKYN